MKHLVIIASLVLSFFTNQAFAATKDIEEAMEKMGFYKNEIQITDSSLPNYKNVITPEGVFFVSEDGKFLTQGPVYDMQGAKAENMANNINLKIIFPIISSGIVYKAENEKYMINVFTDYSCGYCKKLHNEIDNYLKSGISVRYFAFPRQGLSSQTAKDMQSAWSNKDRKTEFDKLYKTGRVIDASSMVPYVKMHYEAGKKLGIRGTPAILLPTGELVGGYVPADNLINMLQR